jgi:hypothetical protein
MTIEEKFSDHFSEIVSDDVLSEEVMMRSLAMTSRIMNAFFI